jgi:hypothetical protein
MIIGSCLILNVWWWLLDDGFLTWKINPNKYRLEIVKSRILLSGGYSINVIIKETACPLLDDGYWPVRCIGKFVLVDFNESKWKNVWAQVDIISE